MQSIKTYMRMMRKFLRATFSQMARKSRRTLYRNICCLYDVFFFKKNVPRAKEVMAQWEEDLLCKHEDLS